MANKNMKRYQVAFERTWEDESKNNHSTYLRDTLEAVDLVRALSLAEKMLKKINDMSGNTYSISSVELDSDQINPDEIIVEDK